MSESDIAPGGAPSAELLSRQLGTQRMQQVLGRAQEAQSAMDRVSAELSRIDGGEVEMGRARGICRQIRAFWYRLEALSATLHSRGGPRVVQEVLQLELQRRQQQGKPPGVHGGLIAARP